MTITEFTIYTLIQHYGFTGDKRALSEQMQFKEIISVNSILYYCEKGVKLGYIKKTFGGKRNKVAIYSKGDREFKL